MNPYYEPEKLGLKLRSYDEPDLSYEYNTLCFWATEDGRVYTASDCGCSCPTPFEDYEGTDLIEVLQKLERVGSVLQACSVFDAWNKSISEPRRLSNSEKRDMAKWVSDNLKS